ncbi:hypothetical protein [Aeromonas veronii]|uniref:hypothetical protein n=1 Tax=Aeromonas veronii TaxID=654 RepID=UPI001F2A45BF|nr:hypothetical protein [Aeromonas veronii]MCF7743604.1 hypothetical protein [Aeromonas veronii]MCF7744809.1 hypothetical protein [Aeromonas veronii]
MMKIFLGAIGLDEFDYPQGYLTFLESNISKDFEPWTMLAHYEKRVDSWRKILSEQYPEYSLIPFAKYMANDDVACFDLKNDDIVIINSFSTIDCSCHGTYPDFDKWLTAATAEHESWNDEDEDEDE